MKDALLNTVRNFLAHRLSPGRPLLVGYSGGPDSQALFHLLLACRRFFSLELHLAHVDHGWREESAAQAEQLRLSAQEKGVHWHLKTLSRSDFEEGNLEEQGRKHRLSFFLSLYQKFDCQALLLGHQGEDLAEGVLKRIFEGAHLSALGGLSEDSHLEEMRIWRPLLSAGKKEILAWLEERGIPSIDDPTNRSPQFLRGRMRQEMLPFLRESFGKEISSNLCSLGRQSHELKEYFSQLNRPFLASLLEWRESAVLDLSSHLPMASLQLKFLIKELLFAQKITVSRQILEGVVSALQAGEKGKEFRVKGVLIGVENGAFAFKRANDSGFEMIENNS